MAISRDQLEFRKANANQESQSQLTRGRRRVPNPPTRIKAGRWVSEAGGEDEALLHGGVRHTFHDVWGKIWEYKGEMVINGNR